MSPRAAVGMVPLLDLLLVLDSNDVFHFQALRPRESEPLVRRLKVVRYVALAADVGTHLLARGHGIDVVVLHSLRSLQRTNAFHEGRTGDAQLHGLRIVAIDAGHRMLHVLAYLLVGHVGVADDVETLCQVAITQL